MTEIEQAEASLAKLDDKRKILIQRATELEDERNKIAFAAHVEGEPKSVKRLDAINSELAKLVSEQGSILGDHRGAIQTRCQQDCRSPGRRRARRPSSFASIWRNSRSMASTPTTRCGTR